MSETPNTQAMGTMSPPYPPTTAALGGVPTVDLDVPICAVFMFLFILGGVAHMTIFTLNRKRSHKFIISGMLFGFCIARTVTMTMRIVWACYPTNIRVVIAAQVFTAAGVVLLFIVNLLFAQRILRAQHPNSGWHPITHYAFISIYVLIVLTLIMLITSLIQTLYSLNTNTRRIDRDIVLYGGTFYAVISFLPIPIAVISLLIPRAGGRRTQKFGEGRFRNKLYILLLASILLCLGASFRVGTNYLPPRPRSDPPGYYSKACFYIFNFTVEFIVIFLYVVVRVDKRFWVPNGSHGPGDYLQAKSGPEMVHKQRTKGEGVSEGEERIVGTEEEVFDDVAPEKESKEAREDLEKGENGVRGERALEGRTAVATPEPAQFAGVAAADDAGESEKLG